MNSNFYEGRRDYPSTITQNVQDRLTYGRSDSLKNYIANQVMKTVGDVKQPTINQAVQGGINIINPQIQGEIRHQPVVAGTPCNRVLTKYENNRRNTQRHEAIYDTRNNNSLNYANKVANNWYINNLQERAKSKVFQKNFENYRFQFEDQPTFNDYSTSKIDSLITPSYTLSGLDNDTGTLNFTSINNPEVETTSYNPMLAQARGNLSRFNVKPSIPDERLTRYSGERKYVTYGDRVKQARDLATSDYNKERRQLQANADHAFYKTNKTARQIGHSFGQGINVNYVNPDNFDNDVRQMESIQDAPDMSTGEEFRTRKTEHFLPRSTDLNNQRKLEQDTKHIFEQGIENIQHKITEKDINRKIHEDNGDTKLFTTTTGFNEQFEPEVDNKLMKQVNYKNDHVSVRTQDSDPEFETQERTLFDKFIGLFSTEKKKRIKNAYERDYSDDDSYDELIENQKILKEHFDSQNIRYPKEKRYYSISPDVKEVYEDNDFKHQNSVITKPVSILKTNGEIIVRQMVAQNRDKLKLMRIRTDLNGQIIGYDIIEIPKTLFENSVRKKIGDDIRCDGDILNLSYEDHLKAAELAESIPGQFITKSDKVLNVYQREFLENPREFITNIPGYTQFNKQKREHNIKHNKQNGDFEHAYYNKGIKTVSGTNHDSKIGTGATKEVIHTLNQVDTKKLINRFDDNDD